MGADALATPAAARPLSCAAEGLAGLDGRRGGRMAWRAQSPGWMESVSEVAPVTFSVRLRLLICSLLGFRLQLSSARRQGWQLCLAESGGSFLSGCRFAAHAGRGR